MAEKARVEARVEADEKRRSDEAVADAKSLVGRSAGFAIGGPAAGL